MQQPSKRTWWNQGAQPKPVGGYRLIAVADLCGAWLSYARGDISLRALNAWFACHELEHRRSWLERGRTPRYRIAELERLTGGGEARARRSLRELVQAGLIQVSSSSLRFLEPSSSHDDVAEMLSALGVERRGRLVPIPRVVVRLLAAGTTRARIATVLGHALRCLHGGGRSSVKCTGLVKASEVAEAFGISERSVKRERAALLELGLLERVETPQWVRNRYGERFDMKLDWSRPTAPVDNSEAVGEGATSILAPPMAPSAPLVSPLGEEQEPLLTKSETQTPASPVAGSSSKKVQTTPSLGKLLVGDLRDDVRLARLFAQEVAAGTFPGSDADRLRFFAAAEHALAVGTANPCGLFRETVRSFALVANPPADLPRKKRYWLFITLSDEDAARERLKRLAGEADRHRSASPAQRNQQAGGALSSDARIVGQLRRALRGRTDDQLMALVEREHGWTAERWVRAATELATQHRRPANVDQPTMVGALLDGCLSRIAPRSA